MRAEQDAKSLIFAFEDAAQAFAVGASAEKYEKVRLLRRELVRRLETENSPVASLMSEDLGKLLDEYGNRACDDGLSWPTTLAARSSIEKLFGKLEAEILTREEIHQILMGNPLTPTTQNKLRRISESFTTDREY